MPIQERLFGHHEDVAPVQIPREPDVSQVLKRTVFEVSVDHHQVPVAEVGQRAYRGGVDTVAEAHGPALIHGHRLDVLVRHSHVAMRVHLHR